VLDANSGSGGNSSEGRTNASSLGRVGKSGVGVRSFVRCSGGLVQFLGFRLKMSLDHTTRLLSQ
jgi:hypothetical protein